MSEHHTIFGKVLLLILLALPAWAQSPMQKSPHNLTSENTDERQVCMACHIPGGTAGSHDPLWQQQGTLPQRNFSTFDTLGRSSEPEPGRGSRGSVSIACLSCHDGTQAPGITGVPTTIPNDFQQMTGEAGGSDARFAEFTSAGQPRSGEHPVGIEYARGRYSEGVAAQGTQGSTRFSQRLPQPASDFHAPQRDVIDGQVIWWLGNGGVREKEDVQLYTRVGQDGRATPYIECASCHDPHAARTNLLRRDNSGSRLCLSCHNN
jgi:predicted CXXCH cytochrome family protein